MLELLKHLPEYRRWIAQTPEIQHDDLTSYRYHAARIHQALIVLDLAWPEFIEIDGLVLRKGALPENWTEFEHEAQEAKWSKSDIEYVINHVHLLDFFINDPDRDEISSELYAQLAHVIAAMWQCKLEKDYPNKTFAVGVAQDEVEPEVYAYMVREEDAD